MQIMKENLNLAGEYRVAAELFKRNLFATITYGNRKGTDIYAIGSSRKAAVVEVKASQSTRFVTGFYQKYGDKTLPHPDFWVLCYFSDERDRFFVLDHNELAKVQGLRNSRGKELPHEEYATSAAKGVDNVLLRDVELFEGQWQKILDHCNQACA